MLSQKVSLHFGKYTADLSAVAEISPVPVAMRPTIGVVAGSSYKRGYFSFHVGNAGAAAGEVKLMNGSELLGAGSLADGSGTVEVDLAAVQGQTKLEILVDVTTIGNATAELQARLDIEYAAIGRC